MGLHGNSWTFIENVERYQQTARNIHVLYRTNIARGILDLHHVNPRSNKKQTNKHTNKQTNKQRSRNRVGQMGPGPKIWPNQIFWWRRNRPNLFFHLQCFYLSNPNFNTYDTFTYLYRRRQISSRQFKTINRFNFDHTINISTIYKFLRGLLYDVCISI